MSSAIGMGRCQVRIRHESVDGSVMVFDVEARSSGVSRTPRFRDVSNLYGGPSSVVRAGETWDVKLSNVRPVPRRSSAEQLALAILDGDLSAAGMLADHVLQDLGAVASGGETRDQLYGRIEELQRQLSDANDREQVTLTGNGSANTAVAMTTGWPATH